MYLLENEDTPTQEFVEQIQDFIDDGFVSYSYQGQRVYQIHFYHSCMTDYHHLHNWMSFLDLDEFIVIQNQYASSRQTVLQTCQLSSATHFAATGLRIVLTTKSDCMQNAAQLTRFSG